MVTIELDQRYHGMSDITTELPAYQSIKNHTDKCEIIIHSKLINSQILQNVYNI